jgi:hypothetical protein
VPAVHHDVDSKRFLPVRLHRHRLSVGDDKLLHRFDELRGLGLFRLHRELHFQQLLPIRVLPERLYRHRLSVGDDELVLGHVVWQLGLLKLQPIGSDMRNLDQFRKRVLPVGLQRLRLPFCYL